MCRNHGFGTVPALALQKKSVSLAFALAGTFALNGTPRSWLNGLLKRDSSLPFSS